MDCAPIPVPVAVKAGSQAAEDTRACLAPSPIPGRFADCTAAPGFLIPTMRSGGEEARRKAAWARPPPSAVVTEMPS
jgi:hypothetical protein